MDMTRTLHLSPGQRSPAFGMRRRSEGLLWPEWPGAARRECGHDALPDGLRLSGIRPDDGPPEPEQDLLDRLRDPGGPVNPPNGIGRAFVGAEVLVTVPRGIRTAGRITGRPPELARARGRGLRIFADRRSTGSTRRERAGSIRSRKHWIATRLTRPPPSPIANRPTAIQTECRDGSFWLPPLARGGKGGSVGGAFESSAQHRRKDRLPGSVWRRVAVPFVLLLVLVLVLVLERASASTIDIPWAKMAT